jgi:hypothetical protein
MASIFTLFFYEPVKCPYDCHGTIIPYIEEEMGLFSPSTYLSDKGIDDRAC